MNLFFKIRRIPTSADAINLFEDQYKK